MSVFKFVNMMIVAFILGFLIMMVFDLIRYIILSENTDNSQ